MSDLLTSLLILSLALVSVTASLRRRFWLMLAMLMSTTQAVTVAVGNTRDPEWLQTTWLQGELAALIAALCLVIATIIRETAPIPPFRRLCLRVAAGATGASLAGLVWITARYETPYWIFVTERARFWLAAAIALTLIVVFVPHRASRETWFVLGLAAAHALTGALHGPQWAFRCALILLCVSWLLAESGFLSAFLSRCKWLCRRIGLHRREIRG